MALTYPNITIGTAGHIDHGKTALVKCLTGCETDRLKEEKERGMSIELGFAPCRIDEMEVGIVDVPGHEDFIKTMVAGASGMDAVLLVVAADDGVMPQTREHLDILTLLGVGHGIVALTKIDRVEPERREAALANVTQFLKGTFLEGAPVLPVSNVTGEGFEPFYEGLSELVRSIRPKPSSGVFRLPVERAFSVKGCGTVVSGIPVSGSIRVGDELELLPHGVRGQVRQVEVYGRASETCVAGQCAALAVRRWDHTQIVRGDVAAAPGYFSPGEWYACTLRLLAREPFVLKTGTRGKFHTGTSEVTASVYLMEGDELRAGDECLVQVRLGREIVAGPGDRFILRALSPARTVGGGTVIEAVPRRVKRTHAEVLDDLRVRARAVANEKEFVEYCVRRASGLVISGNDLSVRAKVPPARLEGILEELAGEGKVLALGSSGYIHAETASALEQRLVRLVGEFHGRSPESPGIVPEDLQRAAELPKAVFDGLVPRLRSDGRLVERNRRLAVATHRETLPDKDGKLLARIEERFRGAGLRPPGPDEVEQEEGIGRDEVARLLRMLLERERLVQVAEGLFFHRDAVERAREILVDFIQKEGELESVKFKYLLGTTRKFAIPLLDYFDRIGVTVSRAHTRYLKRGR